MPRSPGTVTGVRGTTRDAGPPGRDDQFGAGVVDPYAALTASFPSPSPSSAAPPLPGGSPVRGALVGGGAVVVALFLFFGVARPLLRSSRRR